MFLGGNLYGFYRYSTGFNYSESQVKTVLVQPNINLLGSNEYYAKKYFEDMPKFYREAVNKGADLVIFPELGFSGYIFDDTRDIEEYLEFKDRGPKYDFMKDLARKLDSYVVYSIPEKVIDELVADGYGEYNIILILSYFIIRL